MVFDCQGGKGKEQNNQEMDDSTPSIDERSPKRKVPHCSICGHPGRKESHRKFSCVFCGTFPGKGCLDKPEGFACDCFSCDMVNLNLLVAAFLSLISMHYIMQGLFNYI